MGPPRFIVHHPQNLTVHHPASPALSFSTRIRGCDISYLDLRPSLHPLLSSWFTVTISSHGRCSLWPLQSTPEPSKAHASRSHTSARPTSQLQTVSWPGLPHRRPKSRRTRRRLLRFRKCSAQSPPISTA